MPTPASPPGPRPDRLLDRVRATLRTRHYSPRTEKAYVQWIRRFIVFHGMRHPEEMETSHVVHFLSDLATRHRVSLRDGRSFSAMCAIDSMGSAFTFEQDIEIESECSECGERIFVRIERGKLAEVTPSSLRVLHVDLKRFDNWAAAV